MQHNPCPKLHRFAHSVLHLRAYAVHPRAACIYLHVEAKVRDRQQEPGPCRAAIWRKWPLNSSRSNKLDGPILIVDLITRATDLDSQCWQFHHAACKAGENHQPYGATCRRSTSQSTANAQRQHLLLSCTPPEQPGVDPAHPPDQTTSAPQQHTPTLPQTTSRDSCLFQRALA
jgi:hypothetical protein